MRNPLLRLATLGFGLILSAAQAATITVNGYDAATGGQINTFPFGSSNKQEINYYDPSLFTGLSGDVALTHLGFRAGSSDLNQTASYSDFEIYVSTVAPGSQIFLNDNYELDLHGANRTLVHDGALSFTTGATTLDFFSIALDTAFLFDTSQTLVVELINRGTTSNGVNIDAFDPGASLTNQRGYSSPINPTVTTERGTKVAMIELTYGDASLAASVPSPGGVALLMLGGSILMFRRRLAAERHS